MTAKVKICGITTSRALTATIDSGATYVGFNFFAPSPRFLSTRSARDLGEQAAGRIVKVGVFVDPADQLLGDAIEAARLDVIQLHKVDARRREAIRAHFGLPVWSVIPVRSAIDLARRHQTDQDSADLVLYDAATPTGAALPGGMGVRMDWTLLRGFQHRMDWGLAGGLDPANVAEAIRVTGAPLVDVASGVESAPGVKDVDKIAAFIKAARS